MEKNRGSRAGQEDGTTVTEIRNFPDELTSVLHRVETYTEFQNRRDRETRLYRCHVIN